MSSTIDTERIDTLLALALLFQNGKTGEGLGDGDKASESGAALRLLSGLDEATRKAARGRLAWHEKLSPEKQARWLAGALAHARARLKPALFDEHIHVSHVVEALRGESARVRRLILNHLPARVATEATAMLDLESSPSLRGDSAPVDGFSSAPKRRVIKMPRAMGGSSRRTVRESNDSPAPEIIAVIQRTFLAYFATAEDVRYPTALDTLSGIELARLVRLAGVRETALACRGIEAVESIASFLRRFAPEDARAIAAHITTLTEVEPSRIRFAEKVIHTALSIEPETGAMLDRAGMRLLAISMSGRGETGIRYTQQKFPVEAADTLRRMIEESRRETEPTPSITKEIEELATKLRRESLRKAGS